MPDAFHEFQPQLLRETFQPPNYPADQIFIGTDLNLYDDTRHPLWYERPDWFVVLGVPRSTRQQQLRLSYVIWQEGVSPYLVVELLSPGTEAEDLGQTLRAIDKPPNKWEVYQQLLRIPYYVLFDRYTNQLRVFRLEGARYRELALTDQSCWFEEVELGLRVWQGTYQGVSGFWLRWFDAMNQWVSLATERVEHERQRAEHERQRAERLAAKLRELGIDPDQIEGSTPLT